MKKNWKIISLFVAAAILDHFIPSTAEGASLAIGALGASLIGSGIVGGSGIISSLLNNKKGSTTVSQVPLQTGEEREAMQLLLELAKTGTFGDFTAGEKSGLPLGDFEATGIEKEGLNKLTALLQGSLPSSFLAGKNTLEDLLSDKFDPFNPKGEFKPFKDTVEKNLGESVDRLKRNAAFAKDLFSTNTIKELRNLEEEGQSILTNKLAQLNTDFIDRKASLIPTAGNFGTAEENIKLGRVGASQQFGGLSRILNDTKIQREFQEFLRQRGELQIPINAAGTVASSKSNFGVPSVTTPGQNPFSSVLDVLARSGGQILGNAFNKAPNIVIPAVSPVKPG